MQASNGSVIATIIICAAILLGGGIWGVSSVRNSIPEAPVINVPTASDIANAIEGRLPTAVSTGDSDSDIDDILLREYQDEADDIEEDCWEALWDEYENDYMDDIRDLIEDEINDDIEDVSIEDWNYRDNYDFTVTNLGLDDEEDRAGNLEVVFRVGYFEVFGDNDQHFERVYVDASCSDWDDRDNEFDTLDVTYTV